MVTIKQWEAWMKKVSNIELENIDEGARLFMIAPKVKTEFQHTGVGLLGMLAHQELRRREDKRLEGY